MLLEIRGFSNGGYCFMYNGKAVSVHEAMIKNCGKFNKRTIDALNRKNLANENDLKSFEEQAKILHTGLDAFNARMVLRNHFNIDVLKCEYQHLSSSEICDLKLVYDMCKYTVTVNELTHSPMYYFFKYLSTKNVNALEKQ